MERVEAMLAAWAEGQWEFTLAFEGLEDKDLWVRPHPNLLSIGELAGHVAYNDATMAKGRTVESPLVDKRFAYYDGQVQNPMTLDLTVAQVLAELEKVNEAAKHGLTLVQNFDETVPWRGDMTWYQALTYRVFHVAYHTGQAYSVRHLMGHTTTDN